MRNLPGYHPQMLVLFILPLHLNVSVECANRVVLEHDNDSRELTANVLTHLEHSNAETALLEWILEDVGKW